MDFQNRAGGKTGSGGVASWSESNRDRRERLRQLALETIDLNKVKWSFGLVYHRSIDLESCLLLLQAKLGTVWEHKVASNFVCKPCD